MSNLILEFENSIPTALPKIIWIRNVHNNNFYRFQAYIKKDFMSVSAKIKYQCCGFLVASEEN